MVKNSLPVLVFLVFTTVASHSTLAAPDVTAELDDSSNVFRKKILRGDAEINPEAALGYSSFGGLRLDANLSYRYFFFDNISIGGILGFRRSDLSKSYKVGLSGRWYFYETQRWAYSFTQNIIADNYSYNLGGSMNGQGTTIHGNSAIGSHYFFTPNVSLGINLEYAYPIGGSRSRGEFVSRVGLGFNF